MTVPDPNLRFSFGILNMHNSSATPYPRYCAECDLECVTSASVVYHAEIIRGGKLHQFIVDGLPIDQCQNCGEQWFTPDTDESLRAGLHKHFASSKHGER